MERLLLFVNPVFDQRAAQRDAIVRIAALLGSAGLSVEVHEMLSAHSAGEQARQGIVDGFGAIFICGGDGTIFNVIQGVAGTTVPVGILPFGTGNVLAQNIGLPRNPVEAAKKLLKAKPRTIPLARITVSVPDLPLETGGETAKRTMGARSWYFTMAAGMGPHAAIMDEALRWGKHQMGRASYFLAGTSLLLRHEIQPFEVEVTATDGAVYSERVCEAIAVRVREINRWRPGGNLEEPYLRLATVAATGRWGLAKANLLELARSSSRSGGSTGVRYRDALRIVCRPTEDHAYRDGILAEADGEVLGASHAVIEMAAESYALLWP